MDGTVKSAGRFGPLGQFITIRNSVHSRATRQAFGGDATAITSGGREVNDNSQLNLLIDEYESLLRSPVAEDELLSSTGKQACSHAFLRKSTQAVYMRQVEFLSVLLQRSSGRDSQDIKVLDWGCGKGHISYLLRARGFDVTSCDVSSSAEDSCFGQETPILEAMKIPVIPLEDPVRLPFADASFDCVVSFGVLEHVHSDRDSLLEIHRVLRSGGILFVVFVPYFLAWTQAVARLRGNDYHDRLYTVKGLSQLAAETGFRPCGLRHAQVFPKNSMPLILDRWLEPLDRFLCSYTPLKYFATNLEAVLVPDRRR